MYFQKPKMHCFYFFLFHCVMHDTYPQTYYLTTSLDIFRKFILKNSKVHIAKYKFYTYKFSIIP